MRMIGALALVLAAVAAGCEEHCGKIHQSFVLESPDGNLQALLDACVAGPTCLPLCQRVLDIAGQFPGTESIEDCYYQPPRSVSAPDAGLAAAGRVDVTYRLSSCP